jgi:acetate---CoA ligase (ADP-forming)
MRIEALFRPKSIAIVGASKKPAIGRRLIASLDRIGFAGAIYPINPNYAMVLRRPCYPSIADTSEALEVSV